MRAAARTSPLVMALLATKVVVSGNIETRQRASARRWVGSRGVTSVIRAPPSGSRWARLRSDTNRKCTASADGAWPFALAACFGRRSGRVGSRKHRVPIQGVQLPTYEYACKACGHRLEAVQKFTDDALTVCPECEGTLRKVFGAPGIVLKGSGFYKTDARAQDKRSSSEKSSSNGSDASKSETKSDSGTTSDSGSGSKSDGSSTKTGTSTEKPAKESKPAAAAAS